MSHEWKESVLRDLDEQQGDELLLCPQELNQYIGQDEIKEMLYIFKPHS